MYPLTAIRRELRQPSRTVAGVANAHASQLASVELLYARIITRIHSPPH